jgi:hypothetical protein
MLIVIFFLLGDSIMGAPSENGACVPGEPMKWAVYKEVYLELLEARTPNTVYADNVRRTLDRFTQYRGLALTELDRITQLDLELYVARRQKDRWRDKPLTNKTLNNEIQILNTAFTKAGPRDRRGPGRRNLGLMQDPPYMEPFPEYEREAVVLTTEQLQAFLEAAKRTKYPKIPGCTAPRFWMSALLLDLVTSLRRRALLFIPRPDDRTLLELREIVLPPELNKTRKQLRISLGGGEAGAQVAEILAALPTKPGEPLLPWIGRNGKRLSLGHFSNMIGRIQRDAGISDADRIRIKDIRSTAGTLVADEFGDAVAKKKLGHSPRTNTLHLHYKSYKPRESDAAASSFLAQLALPEIRTQLQLFDGDSQESCA